MNLDWAGLAEVATVCSCPTMYCTVLYCIVLYCRASYTITSALLHCHRHSPSTTGKAPFKLTLLLPPRSAPHCTALHGAPQRALHIRCQCRSVSVVRAPHIKSQWSVNPLPLQTRAVVHSKPSARKRGTATSATSIDDESLTRIASSSSSPMQYDIRTATTGRLHRAPLSIVSSRKLR